MAIKFRPAIQANVGVPVTELDEKDSKVLEESLKNPEPVKRPEPKEVAIQAAEAKMAVNLRYEPDVNASIFKVLFPGTTVLVMDHDDEWFKLNYKGELVYVRKEYMTVK